MSDANEIAELQLRNERLAKEVFELEGQAEHFALCREAVATLNKERTDRRRRIRAGWNVEFDRETGHELWVLDDPPLPIELWGEAEKRFAKMVAALKTVRRHEGGGPSAGLLHGDWQQIQDALAR